MIYPRCFVQTKGDPKRGVCGAVYDICSVVLSGDVAHIDYVTVADGKRHHKTDSVRRSQIERMHTWD